jgi:hypothetical protein
LAKSKKTLEQNQSQLKANRAELKQIYAAETEINDALLERGILLEKENVLLEKNIASQKRNKKAIDDSAKSIRGNNKFLEDTEDILGSIADKVGKQHKLYKQGESYLQKQKSVLSSIADLTESVADPKLSKAAEKATNAYKKYQQSVAQVADRTAMTGKQQEEANVAIARARKEYDESVASLAKMGEEGELILGRLNKLADETEGFAKNVAATTKEWNAMDAILGNFSGIPAMGELNTLLKTNIRDTLAWKAAVFALGAALGKAAYDYFGAPIKAGMQADKERKQNEIDGIKDVAKIRKDAESIPAQIGQERLEHEISANEEIRKLRQEAAYAGAKAAIQFSAQMQQGAAQFQRAAKTALFGNKLGSVGYGAAQLQLAGISADKIASGMEAASAATGKMPTAKAAADMAIMAERTGQSVDSIASINEMFQRMDGVTESTAMNLSEGLRNMADQAGIGLGGLMKEMAESSKEMLGYQIKSGPALAKQVAYAQSLGVSFGDIAKAGKSMVMNYKDSIKNEMQLSAMLGKNVDLSEVRAKFASGDTEGALKSLQAQGLDPAQMDMFQQDALSQALGGMDLSSLQKVATKQGAQVGGLKAGKAGASNQDFLSRTQAAESALSMTQAAISAETAILDAELSKKIGDAYLADPGYEEYKRKQAEAAAAASVLATAMNDAWLQTDAYKKSIADTAQLDFVSGLKENLMAGGAALLGGIGTSLLDSVGGKVASGIKSMFSKGGGGADAPADGGDAGGGGGLADMAKDAAVSGAAAGADALVPGSGAVVESIAEQVQAVEAPLEEAMTMGQKLKDLGKGIGGFLQSVGQGVGKAIQGILVGLGAGVRSLGMALATPTPIGPAGLAVAAFFVALGAAMWLAAPAFEALAPVMIKIAEVLGSVLVEALKQAGPIITSIFNGIATVIESVGKSIGTVISSIVDGISRLASLNADQMLAVAAGITAISVAVGLFGGASILGAIGSFFGGSVFDDLKEISAYASPIMATAIAVDALASAFGRLSGLDVSSLNKIPWSDMEDFASEGGKFVLASTGGGSFALSKDTTDNIKKMATNTEAMVKLNNTMAKLLKEGFFGSGETSNMKLYIDGKDVSTSMKRYNSNTQNQDPKKK